MADPVYEVVAPRVPLTVIYTPPNEVVGMRRYNSTSNANMPYCLPPEYTMIPMVMIANKPLQAYLDLGNNGYKFLPKKGVVLNKPGFGNGGSGSGPAIPTFGQLWPLRG